MSSTIPVPGKCNTPCKYHKKGACKLGASCRFLHVSPKKRQASPETHQLAVNKTVCNQICKFGRRPFLHMVVLYASDPRVTVFAQEVLEKFLKHGIDVAVQKHLVEQTKFSSSPLALKKKDVRTEHLAEIICSSHADFLIVLGDRNMKNKSCQAKRKGKLMEMKVIEMISLIWKSWPQNPQKTLTRIQNLTQPQTETLLLQYCGLRHASNRVQYLETLINDFKKSVNGNLDVITYDEEAKLRLSNVEKCCVRLHKQLKKCFTCLSEVPVQTDNQASRGCIMSLDYKPNSSRSPRNSISLILQKFLQKVVYLMMKSTEACVVQLAPLPLPNWDEYIKPHLETFSIDLSSLELVIEAPPLVNAGSDDDSDSDDSQSNDSDDNDIANLADLEIDDDMFNAAQTDEESDSMSSTSGLTSTIITKARSVSSPSRMSMPRAWYSNASVWSNDNQIDVVARTSSTSTPGRVSEPSLPVIESETYSLDEAQDRQRSNWLTSDTVWYNPGGREEILSRESPRDYIFEKRAMSAPGGIASNPLSVSDSGTRDSDHSCQFYFSDLVTSPQTNPYPSQPSPRSLNPYAYSNVIRPPPGDGPAEPPGFTAQSGSWPHSSGSWQSSFQSTPSLSSSSLLTYKSPISASCPISAPTAGGGSTAPFGRDTRISASKNTISSKTTKPSSISPQSPRSFNATIGAHLQERQSKTTSLFDLSSPLSNFTSESDNTEFPPTSPTAPLPTPFAPLQSTTPKLGSHAFKPSSAEEPGIGDNVGSSSIGGFGLPGIGRGLREVHSNSTDSFTEFSSIGYGEKSPRSPRTVATSAVHQPIAPISPREGKGGAPFHTTPHKVQSSSAGAPITRRVSSGPKVSSQQQPVKGRSEIGQPQVPALDFEAISQIWGADENLLFDSPTWPWGRNSEDSGESASGSSGGNYDNFGRSHSTEVTVRASAPEYRQKFSSSF